MNNLLPSYEIWNWIKGFEGRYEISNRGRVRTWVKKITKTTRFFRLSPLIRKTFPSMHGYHQTTIGNSHVGFTKILICHREVAKYFIPNPNDKPEVNHIFGNKNCNEWWALEWNTRLENIAHAFKNKLIIPAVGEAQSNTKLKNEQVLEIYHSKERSEDLAIKYGVHSSCIVDIRGGVTWKHMTGGKKLTRNSIKLTRELILDIFNHPGKVSEIAKKFNCGQSIIFEIKSGKKYSHISGKIFERKIKDAIVPTKDLIILIYNSNMTTKDIINHFNVSRSFVQNIKSGKIFSEITNKIDAT